MMYVRVYWLPTEGGEPEDGAWYWSETEGENGSHIVEPHGPFRSEIEAGNNARAAVIKRLYQ